MRRSVLRLLLFLLLAALTLLACRLPASIAQGLAPERPTLTLTSTSSASPTPASATPVPPTVSPQPPSPTPSPSAAYPGPGQPGPYPSGETGAYPGPYPGPYPGAGQGEPYPGLAGSTPYPGAGALPPTPSRTVATLVAAATSYPPPGSGAYPPPYPPIYPPPLGANPAYPGAQSPGGAYPGPAYPGPATLASIPTLPVISLTPPLPVAPAPTQPFAVTASPTLFPTPTRFLTPTPTLTATPTRTPTPLPPPPWISARLRATDPRTVRLASGKVQLVQFFAFWSGPSQAMAPIVQALETEYRGRVNFAHLDIDDPATRLFQRQLGFRAEPHYFLLDPNGRILRQWVGYVTPAQFRQALTSALNP